MKITGLKVHVLEWDRAPHHWRDGLPAGGPKGRETLLRIQTDEGIEGHSTHWGDANIAEINWKLVGRDPLRIEEIWQDLWRNLRSSTIGGAIDAVDVALWDLMGKCTGQPVYRLLGGARNRLPAYASTLTLDSIKEYLDLADDALSRGYRAIKLHAWGRVQDDANLFRALRKHVGDDIVLMYDASSMFTYEDALYLGRVLEDLNYYWYEEPMDHLNLTALARLADALTIPLAVAEATVGGPFKALDHIMAGAADIILTDPILKMKGGFTGVMKTAHICEAFGMQCAIHGWMVPSLHVACAIPNCRYFESLLPEGFFIPPGTHTASTEIAPDGTVGPWEKPGLGMEIDWKWIDSHTIRLIE